jgi:hypothetical protein
LPNNFNQKHTPISVRFIISEQLATGNVNVLADELQSKRGFFSQTLNTFQIGVLSNGEWIGDDFLQLPDEKDYLYSAIASTKVVAFEISRSEYEVMPLELKESFISLNVQRSKWILERIKSITGKIDKVMKLDEPKFNFNENLAETKKKFPIANSDILTLLRKKTMLIHMSDTKSTTLPNSPKKTIIKYVSPFQKTEETNTFLTSTDIPVSNTMYNKGTKLQSIFYLTNRRNSTISSCPSKYFPDRSKLTHAAASKDINSLLPTFPKCKLVKPRLRSLTRLNDVDARNVTLYNDIKSSLTLKKLNQFMIGKKSINLMDPERYKVSTPNPFLIVRQPTKKFNIKLNMFNTIK